MPSGYTKLCSTNLQMQISNHDMSKLCVLSWLCCPAFVYTPRAKKHAAFLELAASLPMCINKSICISRQQLAFTGNEHIAACEVGCGCLHDQLDSPTLNQSMSMQTQKWLTSTTAGAGATGMGFELLKFGASSACVVLIVVTGDLRRPATMSAAE